MKELNVDLIFQEMIRNVDYSNFLLDYQKLMQENTKEEKKSPKEEK